MSTSGLMSALRGAGRQHITASTYGARQATGSHVFRIERYTHVREKLANGTDIWSSPFGVGGHDWRIQFYPNGDEEQTRGHISLYLRHTSHARTGDATATFKMSILDKSWKPWRSRSEVEPEGRLFSASGWGWKKFIKLEDLDKEKHLLENDHLSVLCDVTVTHEVAVAEELTEAPPPFHLRDLAEAIWNKQPADVRIQVRDGETLAAHRWVLEARSPVFNFKADLASLACNGTTVAQLRIDDMDADVCKALLQFMYTDAPPQGLESAAAMAERLLVAAHRYELEKLKLACEVALCKNIGTGSVTDTLALAERHGCTVLREACMQFLSSPGNLNVVLASSDGFHKLKTGCPRALLELYMKKKMPPHEQLISTI